MIFIKLDTCYCIVNILSWQFCLKVDTAKFWHFVQLPAIAYLGERVTPSLSGDR